MADDAVLLPLQEVQTSSSEIDRFERFFAPAEEAGAQPFASAAAGRTILVTGAGGSIGSALVKALAAAGPAQLVLLDSSEHNLFRIQQHLAASHTDVRHECVLGSAGDARLLDRLFRRSRPELIYHAAAFKHVTLLERNPFSAVRNNTLATYALTQAALEHGTAALILISTDKAVNPHSVMGVSKRLAELIVISLAGANCRMNAIRLGNVIGSSGSVVPIFLDQIARQVPLTVTDPAACRYFLSTAETVRAILAAGAAECSGRILLPEMREPERVELLARFLMGRAGNGAGPIRFTGLRPGEKLSEDLLYAAEVCEGTAAGLNVVRTCGLTAAAVQSLVKDLTASLEANDLRELIERITAAVPEYQPSRLILDAIQ